MANAIPCWAMRSRVSGPYRRLREPQPFRLASKTIGKIFDAPDDLGVLVTAVGQRHDHVIVSLGNRIAMTGEFLHALPVALKIAS